MNNILEILDKFSISIGQVKQETAKLLQIQQVAMDKVEDDKLNLARDRASLDQREAAIKKIEDVAALEVEAKVLMKDAQDFKTALQKERDVFVSYKENINKELSIVRNQIIEDGKQLKAENEALKKERALLNEEKENYKIKMAKGIVDLAGKK